MGPGLQLNVTCLALISLMYSISGTIRDKSLSAKQRKIHHSVFIYLLPGRFSYSCACMHL